MPAHREVVSVCADVLVVLALAFAGVARSSPLIIADQGAGRAIILTPAEPTALEKYAAEQMAGALRRMTGGTFEIVHQTGDWKPPPDKAIISIGRTSLARDLTMEGPAWKQGNPEAFRIARRADGLIICGNQAGQTPDYGTIHGVYRFLQMQGVGSYMNGEPLGEVYPQKPSISVDELNVTDAPWLEMRGHDDTVANYLARAGERPRDLIGFDGAGAFARMEYFHAFQKIATPEVRKAHPDWFAGTHNSKYGPQPGEDPPIGWGLSNNGICLSRPEIRNLFIDYLRKRFRENPDLMVASICPDDYNLGYRCECPECTRLINLGKPLNAETDQRSASDLLIDFVNAVAAGLEKEFPDRKIITYAYIDYINPPTTIRVHPNVIVMLVGYWNNSTPQMDQVVHGWQAMGARTLYWYGWLLTRPPIPHALGEWYRNFKRLGIRGVYMEYSAVPVVNLLNIWLAQKLAWDPDADVDKLLDEYFFGLFGPEAGVQMRRMFLAAWEMNPPEHDKVPGLFAAAEKAIPDPESPAARRLRFFKLGWELYHSAYELDDALKAADIPAARQIVNSAIEAQHGLERDYPWSIKTDIWLYNTGHMEYSVAALPALEALANIKVEKPRPEAPAPGPLLCLTKNADLPQEQRAPVDVKVSFDTKVSGDDAKKLLFDGKTQGGVSPAGPLPEFSVMLDLGREYQIDHVEVCCGMTRSESSPRWAKVPVYFEIQLSEEGKSWKPVDRILPRTLKGFAQSHNLSLTSRYIRVRSVSLNLLQDINEIRVWGRRKPAAGAK